MIFLRVCRRLFCLFKVPDWREIKLEIYLAQPPFKLLNVLIEISSSRQSWCFQWITRLNHANFRKCRQSLSFVNDECKADKCVWMKTKLILRISMTSIKVVHDLSGIIFTLRCFIVANIIAFLISLQCVHEVYDIFIWFTASERKH